MPEFNVVATNHTSFTVRDMDRVIALFRDGLGFALLSRAPRDPGMIRQMSGLEDADIEVAFLQGPGHRIELVHYFAPADTDVVVPRPCDTGFCHVAFDVDDIAAAVAAVAPYGLAPINPPARVNAGPNEGGMATYLRDPDGLSVEFIQKPDRAAGD